MTDFVSDKVRQSRILISARLFGRIIGAHVTRNQARIIDVLGVSRPRPPEVIPGEPFFRDNEPAAGNEPKP